MDAAALSDGRDLRIENARSKSLTTARSSPGRISRGLSSPKVAITIAKRLKTAPVARIRFFTVEVGSR
jgi:hypothetical protein